MRAIARLFVLCLSLLSLPSWAETVADLYQVREPVASQQPEERAAALSRALDTLVLRLTGDSKASRSPALAELRKDPQQLISQYGYESGPPQLLVVDFDPISSDRSLRQAGLSLWGSNRPAILTWWLNNASEGASLVGDGQASAAPLRRAAQHRGLPLRLPLADLNEQLVATVENLTATQPAALRPASERYAADALLAVNAQEESGQWQAQWRLWLGDSREQGTAQGADADALTDAVFLAVSERLAPHFVAAPGAAERLTLEVQGANLVRYAELQRLLEPFGARLQKVEGERLTYEVTASAEQLRAQLALAHLQEMPAEAAPVAAGQTPTSVAAPVQRPRADVLRYRW
ncbi:DUF2066 domain-containing protein [Pseudomonas cavernicola]|uniref:DUF2066 domain-containing protein n=1 Tax=Pseudomonas cavernicola TaxID=2320866 RepID=A0A418XC55_9PSED|nr:DUF2066 domain-containing protein [Pseudomonas cavernicola]RJG10082.1 DUF2066 domain-containing protein [Pseudomonas cavernicola]